MHSKKLTIESLTFYYDAILALVPGNLYWKDKSGVLQGCNNNLAKLLGLNSRKDIVNKTDYDIASKSEADAIRKIDFEVMNNKREQVNEEYYTLPDASQVCYLTQRSPVLDEHGDVVGLIGVSFDITDRKKMEEDLLLAKEKAEKANYMMTEFIANMGHDLATPITDVGSIAIMLNEYSDEYPELKDLIQTLTERSTACEAVRKRILNATSLSNLDVKLETFSVTEVLLELEKKFRSDIEAKKLKLIIHPLKPKKEDFIETDREKFGAILEDLLSNAINFTEEGSITISVTKGNGFIHIKVTDTGIGIPADKFDYIFEPYTKLSRSNQYGQIFKGAGCGLYLVQVRANILGATICVESELGKGSTFTLAIPAHPEK